MQCFQPKHIGFVLEVYQTFCMDLISHRNGFIIRHVWSHPHDSLSCPHGVAKGSYSSSCICQTSWVPGNGIKAWVLIIYAWRISLLHCLHLLQSTQKSRHGDSYNGCGHPSPWYLVSIWNSSRTSPKPRCILWVGWWPWALGVTHLCQICFM